MHNQSIIKKENLGKDFKWGVATAAYQIEGAWKEDGKGLSIWDKFSNTKNKIFQNQNANVSCDFYHRYKEDLQLVKHLNIDNYRFSLAWSRILPNGTGAVNSKGTDFYERVVDYCLELGIEPWVTLYHWDLPQALQDKGGWTNRDIVGWFSDYVDVCIKKLGDRVTNWMVLNEPMVFTGAGYLMGVHAPGKRGLNSFLASVHHASLCQARGGRIIKSRFPKSNVGTTFSCSYISPHKQRESHVKAASRVDALLNRLFIEPLLGLGYPIEDVKALSRIEKFIKSGDEKLMQFDMDFIGVQNYTREVVKYSFFTPLIRAMLVKASKRCEETTLMNWEIYPKSIYHMLKKYSTYKNIPPLYVTENGAAFYDEVVNGEVHDPKRLKYIQDYLFQVKRAQREGVDVRGYFVWTFTDNFEWAEGYFPRFGLVHVDFETQERIVKSSGKWYQEFLAGEVLVNDSLNKRESEI